IAYSRLPVEVPDETVAESAYGTAASLRSILTIPLSVAGRPVATLSVGALRAEPQWPAELGPRLRMLCEGFPHPRARRNQAVCVERALAEVRELKARLEHENLHLRKELDTAARADGIVGESAAIRNVLVQAEQVAPTDASVLLLGETGTGKELLAR